MQVYKEWASEASSLLVDYFLPLFNKQVPYFDDVGSVDLLG